MHKKLSNFVLSSHLDLSGDQFKRCLVIGGGGTPSRSLRCRKGHAPEKYVGGGGRFQVLKVSEGTCAGKIFSGMGDHFQVLKVSGGTCVG